jgi:hypothetical protein
VPRWVSLCLAVPRADLQMAATDVAPCRKSRGTCGTLGRSLEYLPTQVPNGETESPLFLWPCFSGVMIYRCRWVIVFMPYAYLHAPEVSQAARVCPWASCLVSVVAVAKDSERVNTDGRSSLAGAMSACLSNTRPCWPAHANVRRSGL